MRNLICCLIVAAALVGCAKEGAVPDDTAPLPADSTPVSAPDIVTPTTD